jgi:hypothetical protein
MNAHKLQKCHIWKGNRTQYTHVQYNNIVLGNRKVPFSPIFISSTSGLALIFEEVRGFVHLGKLPLNTGDHSNKEQFW